MDIKKYITNKKKLIDKALDRYLPSSKTKPQAIHKAMRYSVFPGGKRIRPILTIASFEACGGKTSSIMPVACAIELIHTYTLIHDDLPCMDNDDFRRGKLSCHKKFSENLALLAGDALLTLSFQLLSEVGNVDIIKEISRAIGSCGTIGGQVVDIFRSRTTRVRGKPKTPTYSLRLGSGQAELDYIASHKTGMLFEVAVKAGGLFKGVNKKKLYKLSNFGRLIGFTFQLVDDLIDRDGYVEIYGKDCIRDRAEISTRNAKASLDIFGKKASRLLEAADLILKRQN